MTGTIDGLPTLEGSELGASIAGPNLSVVGGWFGITELPGDAFQLDGSVRIGEGYDLEAVEIRLGPLTER